MIDYALLFYHTNHPIYNQAFPDEEDPRLRRNERRTSLMPGTSILSSLTLNTRVKVQLMQLMTFTKTRLYGLPCKNCGVVVHQPTHDLLDHAVGSTQRTHDLLRIGSQVFPETHPYRL